jgi:hypothetical protein
MDVKSAVNSIIPVAAKAIDKSGKAIKSDSTHDRDANGQMGHGGKEERRRPMTEEELEKALTHIRGLDAVKEHSLAVELIEVDGKKFVLLKEADGKVLRRIPEYELWSLQIMKERAKGQLLQKVA